ncbi:hypothetical protein AN641_08550 [Candidatus Epulonipiscioides gigas]|nr:hypothetical protein AN641_08550 [Epulopiscium sp. SCG-C07WGA-EpuloA2]
MPHSHLNKLTDYYTSNRQEGFIYRIHGKNKYIEKFLADYYEQVKSYGLLIEVKIPTPTEDNIRFYKDVLTDQFILSYEFIENNLEKWLTVATKSTREMFAKHLYKTLSQHKSSGKNTNILKNTYIKFMCWAYFRFQRVLNFTPVNNNSTKILYIGELSKHELEFLSILAFCGADVLIVSRTDEVKYKILDPKDELSYIYKEPTMIPFGAEYRAAYIQEIINKKIQAEKERNIIKSYSNEWVNDDAFLGLITKTKVRNAKPGYFNNIFVCFKGADDTTSFAKKLNNLYQNILETNRPYVIENQIPVLWPNEISIVKRKLITSEDDMCDDLKRNIEKIPNRIFLESAQETFVKIAKEINFKEKSLQKSTNKLVQMLALYKRYENTLFEKSSEYPPIFILFGHTKNDIEVNFLKFLARLYVDVVIILKDPNEQVNNDPNLCIVEYDNKLKLDEFPKTLDSIVATTTAYNAEQDLENLIYTDTGLYKQHQIGKASSLTLRTTCEELDILWKEELKFRPNFNVENNNVIMPVIFAKISGVKNDNIKEYYKRVQNFVIPKNTLVKVAPPFINREVKYMDSTSASHFLKNGRLLKEDIKKHRDYKFGHLRREMQDHLLDKIELLINLRLIEGTGKNGVEYLILQSLLNLDDNFLKQMQKFDFTKQNPKVVVIHTKERQHSIEDAIFLVYSNLVGCDIIIISPTGYRSFERFYSKDIIQEHQDGEYRYDLTANEILTQQKLIPKAKNIIEKMINKWNN